MSKPKPHKLTDTELLNWLEKRRARIWSSYDGKRRDIWVAGLGWCRESKSLRTAIRRAIAKEKR